MSKITGDAQIISYRCSECKNPVKEVDVFCPHCGASLESPNAQKTNLQVPPSLESVEIKRGFWLTAVLVIWMAANTYLVIANLIGFLTSGQSSSPGTYLWMILRGLVDIVFIVAVWKWKKWGVYGILAMLVLGVLVSLVTLLGVGVGQNLPVLIGVIIGSIIGVGLVVAILYFTLRRVWKQMS